MPVHDVALVPEVFMSGQGFRTFSYPGQPPNVGDIVSVTKEYRPGFCSKAVVRSVEWHHHVWEGGEQFVAVHVRLSAVKEKPEVLALPRSKKGKRRPKPKKQIFVYFILNPVSGRVKIGISDNPGSRKRDLQTGNHAKLEVLAVMPGDKVLETWLHERFREYREEGEWFRYEGNIVALVESLVK